MWRQVGPLAALLMAACGGGGAKAPAPAAADAGADAAAPKPLATTPPRGDLPPMAAMPAPGVVGSKKAKRRADPALAACSGSAVRSGGAEAQLKRVVDGCAGASKMKPASAVLKGQQGDKDAHQENAFRAEANHCYRVYVAGDDAARDVVVVMRDSNGDVVAESPGPAVPEEGAVCFTAADQVTLLIGVGAGRGAWAAQVFGD